MTPADKSLVERLRKVASGTRYSSGVDGPTSRLLTEAANHIEGGFEKVAQSQPSVAREPISRAAPDAEPSAAYDPMTQVGDPNFDGAEAYEAHLGQRPRAGAAEAVTFWQPIESAPPGDVVALYWPETPTMFARCSVGLADDHGPHRAPTHWQPLPEAPDIGRPVPLHGSGP